MTVNKAALLCCYLRLSCLCCLWIKLNLTLLNYLSSLLSINICKPSDRFTLCWIFLIMRQQIESSASILKFNMHRLLCPCLYHILTLSLVSSKLLQSLSMSKSSTGKLKSWTSILDQFNICPRVYSIDFKKCLLSVEEGESWKEENIWPLGNEIFV